MTTGKFLCAYFILLNLMTFMFLGMDKQKAKLSARRIPERSLQLYALMGGWAGTWMGILLFRHKTSTPRFLIPLLLITVSWIIGIVVFLT